MKSTWKMFHCNDNQLHVEFAVLSFRHNFWIWLVYWYMCRMALLQRTTGIFLMPLYTDSCFWQTMSCTSVSGFAWFIESYMWHKSQQVLRVRRQHGAVGFLGQPECTEEPPSDTQHPKRHHRVTVFKPLLHLTCHRRGSKAADFMLARR